MSTLLDTVIKKFGSHEKTAKALGLKRQTITWHNMIKDNDKRNSNGFEMLLKTNDEFNESVVCDGYLVTVKKEKLR